MLLLLLSSASTFPQDRWTSPSHQEQEIIMPRLPALDQPGSMQAGSTVRPGPASVRPKMFQCRRAVGCGMSELLPLSESPPTSCVLCQNQRRWASARQRQQDVERCLGHGRAFSRAISGGITWDIQDGEKGMPSHTLILYFRRDKLPKFGEPQSRVSKSWRSRAQN